MKGIILLSLFLGLALAFLSGLIYQVELISISAQHVSILKHILFLIECFLLLLSFKTFAKQFSREYLFLGLGIASILFFQLIYLFHFSKTLAMKTPFIAELGFNLTGTFIFALFFLLAAFHSGKVITLAKRKKNLRTAVAIALMINFGLLFFLKKVILQHLLIETYQLSVLNLLALVNAVILSMALIKFAHLYISTHHNIYFWYLVSAMFFLSALIYMLPNQMMRDYWSDASLVQLLSGFAILTYLFFTENTRFMESEIELRRDLEKSLYLSEEEVNKYQSLIEGLDVGICSLDSSGKIMFINDKLVDLLGYSAKQLMNQSSDDLFDETNLEKFHVELEKCKAGKTGQFEIEMKTRSGKNIPVMINAAPILNKFKKFNGVRMVVLEMADSKMSERELRDYSENLQQTIKEKTTDLQRKTAELHRAKQYYETLISGMLDILLVVDKKGNCVFINQYGKKLLGYEAHQLTRKKLPDFFTDIERLAKNYGDAMKVELRDYEASVKTKGGKKILCNWNVRYLFDPDGKNIGAMCVGRDISEYKDLQKKLEEHSRDLEKLVEQRTRELKVRVNQLSKILKIGEEIALDNEPGKILSNICKAIKSIGWSQVVFTLKDEETGEFKITAYAGIEKTRIRGFVNERKFLYQDVFNYIKDEYKISKSYLVKSAGEPVEKMMRLEETDSSPQWRSGDVLIIPVKIGTKILGFINVFNPVNKKYPDEQQIQVLEIFAHKAAVALENRRLFEETKIRAKELARASKIKTNFFTTMSHELRTPLNSIISLTDVLLQQMSGELNAEQLRQIRIIKQNGRELLKLINNLLNMSKIDAGRMDVSYSYFSINKLIQDNADIIRPLCERKKLKLDVKLDKNLPKYIFSDQEKINHVVSNLLSNAVKFTQKGKIEVIAKFSKRRSEMYITVIDSGIGMTKEESTTIFHAFTQVKDVDRRKYEGSGLGLAISKQFINVLGGKIQVESKKGKGTKFRVTFPVKDFGKKGDEVAQAPTTVTTNKKKTTARKRKVYSKKRKLILLVDDNMDNQYAVRVILEEQGHNVLFAENGAQGIKKAIKEKPDLILMDMMMPGIDGYQATRKIRNSKGLKYVPIIAMTAKTVQEDKRRAIYAGCNDYLTKPFTLEEVQEKLKKWLGDADE